MALRQVPGKAEDERRSLAAANKTRNGLSYPQRRIRNPMISNGRSRRPNVSRVYDALLGGKDAYEEDRRFAGELLDIVPDARAAAWANKNFVARAIRFAVKDAGIRQLVDIGCGLPSLWDTGRVARELEPEARVVYADNDPVVVSHARALLCGYPGSGAVDGDLRDPAGILDDPELQAVVDLREPVIILLTAVLHFIPDEDRPHRLAGMVKAAMAPGSVLVVSHGAGDGLDGETAKQVEKLYQEATAPAVLRSGEEIARFFDGLELVPPGLAGVASWRADPLPVSPGRTLVLGGAGRKP
jgi:SAM-dependent methyltransferase